MKISSASKKVLASALSAAMVVAFAPTVAFGAQANANQKITVNYDFGAGVDTATEIQKKADLTKTYEVTTAAAVSHSDEEKAAANAVVTEKTEAKDAADAVVTEKNTALDTAKETYGAAAAAEVGDVKKAADYTAISMDDAKKLINAGVSVYKDAQGSAEYANYHEVEMSTGEFYKLAKTAELYTEADITAAKAMIAAAQAEYDEAVAAQTEAATALAEAQAAREALDAPLYEAMGAVVELQSGAYLKILSNNNNDNEADDDYAFDHWAVYYDANGNGKEDAGEAVNVVNNMADVSSTSIPAGATLTAKAVYKNQVLAGLNPTFSNDTTKKKTMIAITTTVADATATMRGAAKIEVQTPSKTVTASGTSTSVPAEVGVYKVTLTDGNGVVIDSKSFTVGALQLSAAKSTYDTITGETDAEGKKIQVAAQTVYYVANEAGAKKTYASILNAAYGTDVLPSVMDSFAGYTDGSDQLVSYAGTFSGNATVENGAVTTTLTGYYGAKTLLSATSKDNAVTVTLAGFAPSEMAGDYFMQNYTNEAAGDNVKYYLALTDADGKLVAESADTDGTDGKTFGFDASSTKGSSYIAKNLDAGTYTATLYKVTRAKTETDATTGIVSTTAGKMEAVGSKSVTVAGAAAPSWSYVASYKDNGDFKSGVLTLVNNAGDAYDVLYGGTVYDLAKGGIEYAAIPAQVVIKAAAKDRNEANPKTDPQTSKEITLYGCNAALAEVTAVADATNLLVGTEAYTYYNKDAGVAAAITAAKKSITDKGFAEGKNAAAAWSADKLAAEKSILSAVAEVAKAELAKLNTATVAKDGSAKKLTDVDYAKAVKDVDAALAAFDANHDDDKTNNVAAYVGITDAGYVAAINNIVKAAAAAQTTFAKADVAAAAAVTEALQAATTGEAAEAAIKAYEALNATQKELVAAADVAAAEKVIADEAAAKAEEEAKKAEEEAKKAAEEAAAALVVEQDKAAVNYCNSTKSKTVTLKKGAKKTAKAQTVKWNSKVSASGNVVTYAWKSGSTKIKVAAGGVATLKKGTKAGTYKAKVTVTCGEQTRTVTAKFIVKK